MWFFVIKCLRTRWKKCSSKAALERESQRFHFLQVLWASCLHIHKDMENKCNLSVLAHHCMCSHDSFFQWMDVNADCLNGFRFRVHLIQIHILHILFPLLSLNPKPIRTRCKPEQSQWQPLQAVYETRTRCKPEQSQWQPSFSKKCLHSKSFFMLEPDPCLKLKIQSSMCVL